MLNFVVFRFEYFVFLVFNSKDEVDKFFDGNFFKLVKIIIDIVVVGMFLNKNNKGILVS